MSGVMRTVRRSRFCIPAALIFLSAFLSAPCRGSGFDLEACKEAILKKPGDPRVYYNLGGAYCELGRYREAVEAYRKAVELSPAFTEARVWLSMAYLHLGERDSAKEEYKELKEIDKDEAKRLKKMTEAFEDARKEAEKARKKAEKEAEKAELEAAKEARKQEKERLKRKAKLMGVSVRDVQEQEFWEEYWADYRRADPETKAVMRYQMDVYLKRREVAAQEEMARAARDAAAAAWRSTNYGPYWYDPSYCW